MLAIFTKTLELVGSADVLQLVAQTWPEGYEVEFKRTLGHKKGEPHAWLAGGEEIGDYARDELLAEVVALANANGGTVILGIEETRDKPPRAHLVVPLPRAGELARRFEDQARSCIDPPLARLQVRAIEMDGSGGGVVIFRTAPSRAAPHRLTTTRESYVRRGSSTVKMTMREIQDTTLNVARGLAGIEATFDGRRERFQQWGTGVRPGVAYRATAVPLVDLPDPGRIFGKQRIFPNYKEFKARAGTREFDLRLPIGGWDERPRLRGMVRSQTHDTAVFQWELYQNGLTDLWVSARPWKHPRAEPTATAELILYHFEILGAVANVLMVLDHYRSQIGAPDAEYGMEIEIARFYAGGGPPVQYFGLFAGPGTDEYQIREFPIVLPRLAIGPRSEFESVINLVDVDVYDALGIRRQSPTELKVTF